MWLEASMNLLRVGYWCSGGATSVDLPVKLTVTSLLLAWRFFAYGTCICGAIGSAFRVCGVWIFTLGTRWVSSTTLGTCGVNFSTLGNLLPCCGRWVYGGCTANFKIPDRFFMEASAGSSTLNGDAVVGFSRAWVNFDSAIAAASSNEVLGMSKWWGKKSTVSEVLSALVLFM